MTTVEKFIWKAMETKEFKVKVFLVNGYQMDGVISSGDESGIVLYADEYHKEVLIPIGAISTIVPM